MASQPLSDDVLNDTSGFPDDSPAPTPTPAPADPDVNDTLELSEDQELDDSLAADPNTPAEKTENPVEKRIKGALKARDDARNALENTKAENAALAARLAAIEAKMGPAPAADTPEEKAPNPDDYEFGALDQKYIDDSIEFKVQAGVRQSLQNAESQFQKQQQERAQQAAATEAITAAKDIVAKGAALYDDFEEVVWERGNRQEYPLEAPTFEALREAEHPAEIVYALASDVKEAARVAAMTPIQQVKYVMQKDAELAGKTARTTKAPPPPGQQTKGAGGKFTVSGDTEDLDAFSKEFFKKK